MNDLVVKFHIDHQYYIKITPLPALTGCLVNFPKNILLKRPITHRTYVINQNPDSIELFHLEEGKDIISKNIHAQRFTIRLLIFEDILLRAMNRNISKDLIIIEGKAKNIFQMLDIKLDKEELDMEKELCLKFQELLLGKVEYDLNDCKKSDSYEQVLKCFESGGL